MMDKDFATTIEAVYENQLTNPKNRRDRCETMKLLDRYGGLYGNVLDIGERNLITEIFESRYNIKIKSTWGDLDIAVNHPSSEPYDFVHYGNVIEHQFNPLFTLLEIRKILKPTGTLILATPIKPNWITFAKGHFHEFDQYRFDKLIARAGYKVLDKVHYWHDIKLFGIRGFFGSFYTKQAIYLLR